MITRCGVSANRSVQLTDPIRGSIDIIGRHWINYVTNPGIVTRRVAGATLSVAAIIQVLIPPATEYLTRMIKTLTNTIKTADSVTRSQYTMMILSGSISVGVAAFLPSTELNSYLIVGGFAFTIGIWISHLIEMVFAATQQAQT